MAWLRVGDDAATYPALLSIAGMPGADERTVLECFGFLVSTASLSAAHLTDYFLNLGTLAMVGGSQLKRLVRFCEKAGLLTKHTEAGEKGYLLIQDPNFIHMPSREEVERRRNHSQDVGDESITVPVRKRDGDQCRWCRLPVVWVGPKGRNRAAYDHLNPGERATVETLVVACTSCNSARKNNVEAWAADHQLSKPPLEPLYGRATTKWLQQRGYPDLQSNFRSDETPQQAFSQAADDKQRPTAAAEGTIPTARDSGSSKKSQRREKTIARSGSDSGSRSGGNTPNSPAPSLPIVPHSDYPESGLLGSGRVTDLASPMGDLPAWARPVPPPAKPSGRPRGKRGSRTKRPPTKGTPNE